MRGCARSRFVSLAERWRGGGGGALGTTRGHQGSGERTASSQSAAEPARRTVGTCVPRSILRPFGSFASASRAPFAGKLRVFLCLILPCRLAPSDVSRCAIGWTRIQWDLHIFFCSVPGNNRPTDCSSVRPFAGVSFEEKAPAASETRPGNYETTLSDFRWILSCGGIVPYKGGRDDDANLFCMVSTWNYFTLTGADLCSPVDDLRSKFEGTSEWKTRVTSLR